MKKETAELLQKHHNNNKFTFTDVPEGLQIDSDLTDTEVEEIVKCEYGTPTQDVNALFEVIMKKLVKLGLEHGKV
jgi:hypothetical protein